MHFVVLKNCLSKRCCTESSEFTPSMDELLISSLFLVLAWDLEAKKGYILWHTEEWDVWREVRDIRTCWDPRFHLFSPKSTDTQWECPVSVISRTCGQRLNVRQMFLEHSFAGVGDVEVVLF